MSRHDTLEGLYQDEGRQDVRDMLTDAVAALVIFGAVAFLGWLLVTLG